MNFSNNCIVSNKSNFQPIIEEDDFSANVKFIIEGILLLVVGIIGLFGNTVCIIMFSRLKLQLKFHRLMILLFVYENIYLLFTLLVFSVPQLSENYKSKLLKHLAPLILPMVQIALTGSVYTTLAISLERYLVVCRPFYAISHKPLTTRAYVFFIISFSILFNLPKFFELTTCIETNGTYLLKNDANESRSTKKVLESMGDSDCTKEGYKATNLRLNTLYYSIYLFWMNLMFMGIIPYATLLIFNSSILNHMRLHLKHRRECSILECKTGHGGEKIFNECCIPLQPFAITKKNQMLLAKTNLAMVLSFTLCHSLRWIPNIYEYVYHQMYDDGSWVQIVEYLSHLLITLSSSANSYIYRITHFNILTKMRRSIRNKPWTQKRSFNSPKIEEIECKEFDLRSQNL